MTEKTELKVINTHLKKIQNPSQENKKPKAMKTSILISSFAALCLVITFAESTTHHGADKNNSNDLISFVPVCMMRPVPEHKKLFNPGKTAIVTTPVLTKDDFTYLKFNVADYLETGANISGIPDALPALPEPDCSYLKFDINTYTKNTEVSSVDDVELPVNYFDYLRFDVAKISVSNTDSFENMELPADNFSYLKFDVNKYISKSEMDYAACREQPCAETQP